MIISWFSVVLPLLNYDDNEQHFQKYCFAFKILSKGFTPMVFEFIMFPVLSTLYYYSFDIFINTWSDNRKYGSLTNQFSCAIIF